jgi:hypothetical protein
MLPEEVRALEQRYGAPLSKHVIPLKDGMQAYVASYYGDPQLAKKDPAKIFTDDGGSFSKILQSDLTAEKFRNAYMLSLLVSAEVDRFKILKRKRYADDSERRTAYLTKIGTVVAPVISELDVAIPQITIFAIALIFEKYVKVLGMNLNDVLPVFQAKPDVVWETFVELLAAKNAIGDDKSWPTVLKSGTFYRDAVDYLESQWKAKDAPQLAI